MGWVWLLLFFWAPAAWAQPASQPTSQPASQPTSQASADAEARRLFESAEIHFRLQEFALALDEYKAAYQLSSRPGLLFNIGQCYKQLKRYEEALKSYQAFLAQFPDSTLRLEVELLIAETEQLIRESTPTSTSLPFSMPATTLSSATTQTTQPPPLDRRPALLFYAALGSTGLALIASGVGLSAAIRSQDAEGIDPQIVVSKGKQAKVFGHVAEGFFVTAGVSATGAFLLKRSSQKKSAEGQPP